MSDWLYPERETPEELVRRMGVTPVTAHLLARRGITDVDDARAFMEPSLSMLLPPDGLPQMDLATARLKQAIEAKEKILLFGDYDVDGSTGAAVLLQVLEALGGLVDVHIPNRTEGYGINTTRLERAAEEGVRVVVSIDNGIAALEEAAFLAERGLDLIVVDHHTMGEELPKAVALVHPRLPGSTYANPNLCGAGVAFKVAWGTAARFGAEGRPSPKLRDLLLRCLGLVAMGTVADVVELTGENRVLVRYGLKALAVGASPGVRELMQISRVDGAPSTTDVAFRLAPRLNAAGRMGDARRAFQLLVTQDATEAKDLAEELDRENKARRELQARVTAEARAQVEDVYLSDGQERPNEAGIVAFSEGWPHGIVGIVAAKLTELYGRPALVASVEGEQAKGSGRSVDEVDLLASLEPHRDLFARMGGHAAAVGFTIDTGRLPTLREAFDQGVRSSLGIPADASAAEVDARLAGYDVQADVEVDLSEISRDLLDELDRMGPFGQGNPEPLFAARAVELAGAPRLMGKTGAHVSFMLRQGERVMRTVAFGRPELWDELKEKASPGPGGPKTFEVAFHPRINRWRGQARLELELQAIRFPGEVSG